MATSIDRNNLPKGVTIDPNTGRYLITNDKGQTTRVGANNLEELNTYNTSWQTGKPAEVTITKLDGTPKTETFNPSGIQSQQQSTTDYETNRQNLKKAGLFDNGDGTFSERKQNENFGKPISADEAKQRLASVGAAPSTDTVTAKPTPAEVKTSTDSVNAVTNQPSNLNTAPSAGALNSPLTVDSSAGATQVTDEPVTITDRGAYIPINAQKQGEDQPSITAANTPVQPQKVVDEFDGIDAQVAEQQNLANEAAIRNDAQNTNLGLTDGVIRFTREQATLQDNSNFNAKADWRVRLSLAPGADYLYAAPNPGILAPLVDTSGVIFPYTPGISVSYAAQYDATTLTHSNYKYYTYNSSSVDTITLSCDFTAQDVFEANYLLAVIHFFRSMTKMFYGQDENPKNGTPPPLCYLYGLGAFQFDKHPLVIQGFTYTLPTEVDYIRAGDSSSLQSTSRTKANSKPGETRMAMSGIQPGATVAPPQFSGAYRVLEPTYVPTKIQLSITAVPIISRNDISNNFSLKNYATGSLLRGSERLGGGIW